MRSLFSPHNKSRNAAVVSFPSKFQFSDSCTEKYAERFATHTLESSEWDKNLTRKKKKKNPSLLKQQSSTLHYQPG